MTTGPERWTNAHGRTYRRVVWQEDDGRKWRTGVQEEVAREIERLTIQRIRERLSMREVSVGPIEAFSKRSVKEVLDGEEGTK